MENERERERGRGREGERERANGLELFRSVLLLPSLIPVFPRNLLFCQQQLFLPCNPMWRHQRPSREPACTLSLFRHLPQSHPTFSSSVSLSFLSLFLYLSTLLHGHQFFLPLSFTHFLCLPSIIFPSYVILCLSLSHTHTHTHTHTHKSHFVSSLLLLFYPFC